MSHDQGFDHDFGLAIGFAIGLSQMNAANQANAEYNSIRQGYMTQGFGVEQATALTDFYYAPIYRRNAINYRRTKAYGWTAILWYLSAAFLIFTTINAGSDSSSTPDDNTTADVTIMFMAATVGCALVPQYHRMQLKRLLAEPEPSASWTCNACCQTSPLRTSVDALVDDIVIHHHTCHGVRIVNTTAEGPPSSSASSSARPAIRGGPR